MERYAWSSLTHGIPCPQWDMSELPLTTNLTTCSVELSTFKVTIISGQIKEQLIDILMYVTILVFSVLFHSHSRISICPCNCLSGGSVRCDAGLLWGLRHHLRLRHAEERTTRRGLEVGRLQWGCRLWQHGIPRVRWCSWESARRSLSYESTKQRSWTCGEHFLSHWKDQNAFPL